MGTYVKSNEKVFRLFECKERVVEQKHFPLRIWYEGEAGTTIVDCPEDIHPGKVFKVLELKMVREEASATKDV